MDLEELRVYQMAMEMAEDVWKSVRNWDYFAKDTVGKQLVRAADSVAANLSEGFGRYFYKENKQFCYYARGSLYETRTWIVKAKNRSLIADKQAEELLGTLKGIGITLNNYVRSIGGSQAVREDVQLVWGVETMSETEDSDNDACEASLMTTNDACKAGN